MSPSAGGRLDRIHASMFRHRRGWRTYTVSILIAALLVGSGLIISRSSAHPAVTLVSDYLAAVQEGDSEAAKDIAGVRARSPFLTDDAIGGGGWSVDVVALNGGVADGAETVEVAAVLSTPDGRSSTGIFEVRQDNDGRRISNPYIMVQAANPPVGAFGVNGHTITLEVGESRILHFAFPGLLQFNEMGSSLVTRTGQGQLVVTGQVNVGFDSISERLELTDAGHDKLQQQINDLIDECVQNTALITPGCPFGAAFVQTDDGVRVYGLEDITWTVVEYPVVTAVVSHGEFVVAARQPGIVQLSATGTGSEEETIDVDIECSTMENWLRFVIDRHDSIEMSDEFTSDDDERWHTC